MSKVKVWAGDNHNELNERYTMMTYIRAAREVMDGVIDLDPASCEIANRVVKAAMYFTEENNGLSHQWWGNVWLNPPFTGNLGGWIYFLERQYRIGNIKQAIVLYPAAAGIFSTGWFKKLSNYPMCIPDERVQFYQGDDTLRTDHPPFSSFFSYLGPNESAFIRVFRKFGRIWGTID